MVGLVGVALAGEVRRYAVVVGTNDGVEGDTPLEYAELDADRFAAVLEGVGDVRSEDIVSLRHVDADRVRAALDELGARVAHVGAEETLLYFYYSGHADAEALHLDGTRLGLRELTDALERVPVDVRVVVVDACQSGELTRLKGAVPAEPFTISAEDRLDAHGMAIITSSSAGEDAQESDRLRGGMFTHHFVAGLMGAADSTRDHRITLPEAYLYARTETIRATSQARFVQHPAYAFELRGASDLVLTRTEDPGRNAVLSLTEPGSWLVFASGDRGQLVTEVAVEDAAEVLVPPGQYLVRNHSTRGVWERPVTLDRGGTVALRVADMSPVSYGATVRKGLEPTRAAWAATAGGGASGPPTPGLGLGPVGHLGGLVDLEPLTLELRVVASAHDAVNDQLTLRQVRVGADAAGVRKFDVGALAFGLGLRGGVDVTSQWFETTGVAPARRALSGRVGPMASLDLSLGSPRRVLSLEPGADIQLFRRYDPESGGSPWATGVVPTLSAEVVAYAR